MDEKNTEKGTRHWNPRRDRPEDRCPAIGGNLVKYRCSLVGPHPHDHFSRAQLCSWPQS